MATISNTPRPGYVWDATDNVWYPIGTGPHSHADYITSGSAINPNIVDAKGDIIAATAADTVARLAVGSNNQVLTADSSTATGLKWSTPATGALTLVKTQTIGSAVTAITVSDVFSSTYDNYLIIVNGGVFSTDANVNVQLGTTATGYYWNGYYSSPTATNLNGDNGNNTTSFRYAVGGDTTHAAGHFMLIGPNVAKPTLYVSDGWRGTSSKTWTNYRGSETSTTQHTAFTLNVEGGATATGGTIRVYGFANS